MKQSQCQYKLENWNGSVLGCFFGPVFVLFANCEAQKKKKLSANFVFDEFSLLSQNKIVIALGFEMEVGDT